ncbi:MAG: hypothetical protein J6X50_02320 [Bacilli bacterium]|nr:hypothetical protein [Bacilli bacterium]
MALRKGFCTQCRGDEKRRIFDVNKEAEICYCPKCLSPMLPKEAINNYGNLISHYLKKASRYLFETTEYLLAYQTFAHVIDLDETIKVAHFGRILSLVYISTLRTGKINFAYQLHRQEARLFHYQENAIEYYHFLTLLLDALDEYENRMKKRLLTHGYFHDLDCVVMYLKRGEEIRAYKDFINCEAVFFVESNKDQYKTIIQRTKNASRDYQRVLSSTYTTTDGYSYVFYKFSNDGTPLITLQSQASSKLQRKFKTVYLFPKDSKKSGIRDDIYLNNLPLSRLVSISIPFAILLLLVAIVGVVFSFIVEGQFEKMLLYIGSGAILLVSLILVILHFAWKSRLRKKYYNGTNPFIFK